MPLFETTSAAEYGRVVRLKRGLCSIFKKHILNSHCFVHTFHHCSTSRTSFSNANRSALISPMELLFVKEERASEKSGKMMNKMKFQVGSAGVTRRGLDKGRRRSMTMAI